MDAKNFSSQWESTFLKHRDFLLAFAFRMLGSLAEAEDVVQEIFLECTRRDPAEVREAKSWLTKVCSNKAIDHLRSAKAARESYVGPWLPDAIPETYQVWSSLSGGDQPDRNVLLAESLTTSFLLLIERLTPEERAVFLLSEVFEHSFKEISAMLEKSEEACRKIAERARNAVHGGRVKFRGGEEAKKLIARFFDCMKMGDAEGLRAMLADDSQFWSDGGDKVSAVRKVILDPLQTAKFFAGLRNLPNFTPGNFKVDFLGVNGRPGLVISQRMPEGTWLFDTIITFEVDGGKIARVYAQRNPDKFKALSAN